MKSDAATNEPVHFINVITPHPGRLDEFIAIRQRALPDLARGIVGLRSSQLHKSRDGDKAVMIVEFNSIEDHQRWMASDAFARRRAIIAPLIAQTERGYVDKAYEARPR